MTVQWITPNGQNQDVVQYSEVSKNEWYASIGTHSPMPEGYPYLIHRVELSDLKPDTVYFFHIPIARATYKFRTAPAVLESPLKFVVGGDVYRDGISLVVEMNNRAAKENPLFALVGGDIVYSCGRSGWLHRLGLVHEKMDRWMDWLRTWQKTMVTSEGCLIPMIPAIGNHDVMGGYGQSPARAPFFYALFPIKESRGYYVLDFADYLSVIVLDSGHTQLIPGKQASWLSDILKQRQAVPHKFALYHVGAYPSVRSFEGKYHQQIRHYWVPVFDRYGLTAAFEHHDHAYKRTHLLRKGKIDPQGVLYLGDGGWGAAKPREAKSPKTTWYLAKTAASTNVISVTLTPESRHFKAFDHTGNVIDEFSLDNPKR